MNEASRYLLALAEQIVQPYTHLPTLRAAMVTGSSAKGLSDFYSDLDLTFYYADELADETALATIRQQHGAAERKWLIGERAEGGFVEAYDVQGIEVQIAHTTIATWEAEMAQVLENFEMETPLHKALEGTLAGQALYGSDYIDRWKARAANYPAALAEAMVRKHLAFFPLWGLDQHFQTRDATIWFYQSLVQSAHNIMAVLAGLNRLYFTTFQFKRMGYFIQQMQIAPPGLAERMELLFHSELAVAMHTLELLVADVIALVAEHMPQIDTTAAKRRLGWRQQPWQIPIQ